MEKPTITRTNTPRQGVKSKPQHLFQTMDELRVRYGHAAGRRERLMNAASAALVAAVLFGILHAAIQLLEQ